MLQHVTSVRRQAKTAMLVVDMIRKVLWHARPIPRVRFAFTNSFVCLNFLYQCVKEEKVLARVVRLWAWEATFAGEPISLACDSILHSHHMRRLAFLNKLTNLGTIH